jgi:nicotinamide-nucleotide amidase
MVTCRQPSERGAIVTDELVRKANGVAELLNRYGENLGIAESSTGGLVSAALLAVPGASAYFLGGLVVYTQATRALLIDKDDPAMTGIRPSTEAYAILLAARARERLGAAWGLGETGAAGPTGNRYGDAAGHCCIAVVGRTERVITIETGAADRRANMETFATRALELLASTLADSRT